METERKILLDKLHNKAIESDLIDILKNYDPKNPKSAEASTESRKKGNDLLLKHKRHNAETHKAIFSYYCQSIALAPMESQELALAYGNRSYLLLHMLKYQECIQDIDQALELSNSDILKVKLLCRKAECRKRLGSMSASAILKVAQDLANTVDQEDKVKLLKMIDAANALNVSMRKEGMSKSYQKRIADYHLAITNDISNGVSIEYSEKYGRYLVAAKDYQPGDIIFVEKMHVSSFIGGSSLWGCDYCQKHVWSSIPCNYCNWAMYCSESCKENAWNEYHDIDCSIISHLKQWTNLAWKPSVLAVRILIKGIKETGSIANLKKEIELLDQYTDGFRDLLKIGQFPMKGIGNVCSLAYSLAPYDALIDYATIIPYILVSLTKYSKLKDDFNLKQIEDIKMNEDIMFLGSFLIKLIAVLNVNAFAASHDETVRITSTFQNKKSSIEHYDGKRCLGIFFSLLNHSCFPSAEWCCTENNNIIIYALQPIKKHSQIFIRYRYGFEDELPSIRQATFKEKYNFTCDCRACIEHWPPITEMNVDGDNLEADVVKDITTGRFCYEDLKEVVGVLQEERQVDKLHIEKLSALITRSMHWKQPSRMFFSVTDILNSLFQSIYSPESLVFDECD